MTIEYTSHLRADGERMAEAVARDLDAHVPSCPDWNVAKLTIHTGQHHRWVANAIKGGGKVPEDPPKPGLRGDELVEWFRQGWRDLADLLDATDDETHAWSWSGDNRVGFWRRRTALETLVHRWDAENATGTGTALDPELSSDGIDEMFFVHAAQGEDAFKGEGGTLLISSTDVPGSWTVTLEDGVAPRFERGATTDPDVTVEGPAGDVLLFVWGRYGRDDVTVKGDEPVASSILAWLEE